MSVSINPKLEASWLAVLEEEFKQPYFIEIKKFLLAEKEAGKEIYPPGPLIFNAFNLTPFDKVKVVILGQDPYHGPGQAMGLSFSVPRTVRKPRSLANIYKELLADVNVPIPKHGDLSKWAGQGVLLLNAMLTVEHKKAGSHRKIGWQKFTDGVIKQLSDRKSGIVFMLWGNFAKGKRGLIDESKHLVLTAVHPSPLAGDKFLGNKNFSQANTYLQEQGQEAIDWNVD